MFIAAVIAAAIWYIIEMGFAILVVAISCKLFGFTFSWIAVFFTYFFLEKFIEMCDILAKHHAEIMNTVEKKLKEKDNSDEA